MKELRYSILTLACFALLSASAIARPADNIMAEKGGSSGILTQPMTPSSHVMSSDAQDRIGSAGQEPIKFQGEILLVEGDLYTVKAATGKEVQLHVDESTQLSGKLKEGDQIEAEVNPEGHALKLKKATGMN